jgi:hypothetical protein
VSVKVPADMNLVRVCGLGIGYRPPKGFSDEWTQLEGDHQKYLVRNGYTLARCPAGHSFNVGCAQCDPYHGAIAIRVVNPPEATGKHVRFALPMRAGVTAMVHGDPKMSERSRAALASICEAAVEMCRTEIPVEHRAKSSGALGNPHRNHSCPDCKGLGEVSIYPCARCGGSGELGADGKSGRVLGR